MNKEKTKVKIKRKTVLNPVTIAVVSLGAFVMILSIGITPQLMGNSVTSTSNYKIAYDGNGGSGSMSLQTVPVGKQAQLKNNSFKLDGYSFNGWRARRGDNKWLCYMDVDKVYNEWTDVSNCNKYGYSLLDNKVYVKDIVMKGDTLTLYADWIKTN